MKGGYGEKKKMKYNTKTKSFDAGPEIAINKVESGTMLMGTTTT